MSLSLKSNVQFMQGDFTKLNDIFNNDNIINFLLCKKIVGDIEYIFEESSMNENSGIRDEGLFDLIVCNPPYSSERERNRLSEATKLSEPSLALFATGGPLGAYKSIMKGLKDIEEMGCNAKSIHESDNNTNNCTSRDGNEELLTGKYSNNIGSSNINSNRLFAKGSHLLLEVGHGLDVAVKKIFSELSFLHFVDVVKDFKGIRRCMIFRYEPINATIGLDLNPLYT